MKSASVRTLDDGRVIASCFTCPHAKRDATTKTYFCSRHVGRINIAQNLGDGQDLFSPTIRIPCSCPLPFADSDARPGAK